MKLAEAKYDSADTAVASDFEGVPTIHDAAQLAEPVGLVVALYGRAQWIVHQ